MSEPTRHSGLGAHRQPGRAKGPAEQPAGGRGQGGRARRFAAACAAALGLFTAAPAVALPAGGNIRPAADASATAEYPVALTIETVTPQVAAPNGTVTITGHVTNTGKSAIKGAHAAVRKPVSSKPLQRRSELAAVADRSAPSDRDGVELDSPQYALPELNPGQNQSYTLSVAVSDLGLSESGVYELAVDAWGATAENGRDRALGIARTFLPYNPGGADAQPTKVTTLWPLVHAPVLAAQTSADNDQTAPVLRDDSLAAEFAPGGRLYELVDTGSKLTGLTWVVDPDLLDTAFAMTNKQYRVQKPGTENSGKAAKDDNTVPGTGSAAAAAWLDKLRAAVAKPGSQVIALPYADPDLASIAHNGSDLAGMGTALNKAATAGRLTVEGRLSVDTRSDVSWPYQGHLDQQIAGIARQAGSGLVLVNGESMPEPDSVNYTPNALRPIGNGQNAVVADETITALLQKDLSSPKDQTEATQRFLAETFAITHEQPQNQRGLLVMPPRELTADTAKVLAGALQAAEKWTTPVKLDTLAQSTPDPKANTVVPAPTDYPTQARASELSASDLSSTDDIQHNLDVLMRVLTLPQRVRGPFSAAMVRSLSTEWRSQPAAGAAYREGVTKYLQDLTDAVKVPPKTAVTLAGNTGQLQVSVRNDLTQTVTNLKLVLTSTQPNRVSVGKAEELVLPAAQSVTLRFPAEARNNGPVTMTAQLWTTGPDPQKYGAAQVFRVEVTSVTNGVLYVFAGAGLLMLLAALRFVRQRKRRGGRPHEDGDQPVGDGPAPDADGDTAGGAAEDAAGSGPDAPAEESAGGGPAQTPRASSPDGRDRAAGDEKVGP
ncbi:DUF6049 family protein [Kitasatospora sp. SUK 42]|uniref:DUF6049 family protein n=1 Tax=Kitasatospora sp. SUK 42 TaxID=1588882 RepID=UPI001C313CF3|nr:DUF6049 family protein [Kitasatospora sp. SUK 42]MBV2152835.1 hypothetical protein [Kitasatospora sp. SUK 42]